MRKYTLVYMSAPIRKGWLMPENVSENKKIELRDQYERDNF